MPKIFQRRANRPTTPLVSQEQTQSTALQSSKRRNVSARQTFRAVEPANSAWHSPKTEVATKCIPHQGPSPRPHPLAPEPFHTWDRFLALSAPLPDASDTCIESARPHDLLPGLEKGPSSEPQLFHQSKPIPRQVRVSFLALLRASSHSDIYLAVSQTSPHNFSHKRNTSCLETPPSPRPSPASHSSRKLDPVPQLPQFFLRHSLRQNLLTAAATASAQATPHTSLPSPRSSRLRSLLM